ncbi:hypothetical protein BCR33DRAFT_797710 [Rhizoclosmatium globosum]|uniref:Uncharacterized protein n=1 Tax=Rhizoclosmatium globosum TaxID=329046 RepID=A0A1Y2AGF3_9FUNG|nr:hypothetical protein BCR33DRAFT_797710 [Rhizoclosmatium globosum]|eukprot:ORY21562.1 hypothetical protein BCR33DRAFT_797710 [Rhizoclosmatium globosum]
MTLEIPNSAADKPSTTAPEQLTAIPISEDESAPVRKPGHYLTKDKRLIVGVVIMMVLLCCSWSAQWASIILPYWRGDQYHTGGLFQICGDTEFGYDPVAMDIYPDTKHEWRCEPFEQYVDRFQQLFKDYKNGPGDWYVQAGSAKKMIVVSRWFEALTTSMDMFFGVTTAYVVVYPHSDPAKQTLNMKFALIGVLLTPVWTIADQFIQMSYWGAIGVGYFNHEVQKYLYASGDIAWISSVIDLILQVACLGYGVKRAWRAKLEEAERRGVTITSHDAEK